MKLRRTAAALAVASVAILGLTACGGDSDNGTQSPEPSTASTEDSGTDGTSDASTSAGDASITFNGQTQTFELVNCVSGTETSVQGSGSNDTHSLLIDVQEGSGDVVLSNASDMTVYLDGNTSDMSVSDDGSFTATGTGVADFAEVSFELSGTCGMLNWVD